MVSESVKVNQPQSELPKEFRVYTGSDYWVSVWIGTFCVGGHVLDNSR